MFVVTDLPGRLANIRDRLTMKLSSRECLSIWLLKRLPNFKYIRIDDGLCLFIDIHVIVDKLIMVFLFGHSCGPLDAEVRV